MAPAPKREDRPCPLLGSRPQLRGHPQMPVPKDWQDETPSLPLSSAASFPTLSPSLACSVTTSPASDIPEPLYLDPWHHLSYTQHAPPSLPFPPHSSPANNVYLLFPIQLPSPHQNEGRALSVLLSAAPWYLLAHSRHSDGH